MAAIDGLGNDMERTTYRSILRSYTANMLRGLADTDLSPRQRRLAAVLVNLSSNGDPIACDYPPSDTQRQYALDKLRDLGWDAGALMTAISEATRADFDAAVDRASEIIRNV